MNSFQAEVEIFSNEKIYGDSFWDLDKETLLRPPYVHLANFVVNILATLVANMLRTFDINTVNGKNRAL